MLSVRFFVGGLFSWDQATPGSISEIFAQRLTDEDRVPALGRGESADRQRAAMAEAGMMQEFARMEGDPRPGIKVFGVSYVAIQATRPDPDYPKRG